MATENKVLNTRIKLKRDTSANWESNNPTLLNGEIIIVDTAAGEVRFKIGDGSKTYTQLPFEDEGVRNLIADKSKITVETWTDSSGSTAQFLNELVINKVKDRQTYEEMVDAGKIDTNKLYFIEENDEIIITAHATTGTKIATIAVGDEVTDIYAPPGGVTSITAKDGISSNTTTGAITLTNSGVRSVMQDTTDAHKLIINTNGTNKTITLPNDKTSYTGEAGIEISGTAIKHSNAITAGSAFGSAGDLAYGGTFAVPSISYDAQGHITSTSVTQMKLPDMPTASDLGISGAMRFIGVVNSLPTSNNSKGDVVLYGKKEYVWDGTTWVELGDESSFSIKGHTHSVTHKPAGTVSKPSFTGTQATISSSYTPAGTISTPTFTGDEATITVSFTPEGTVSKPTFTGSAVTSLAPDTTNVTTIYSITGVGSLPSLEFSAGTLPSASLDKGTLPSASISDGGVSLTGSVSNRHLTIGVSYTKQTLTWSAGTLPSLTWNAGTLPSATFTAGSLPTRSSAISMPNTKHTHSVTAAGSVSQPTFTGTADSASSAYVPSGIISTPYFTGTAGTATATYTPAGSVSQPTFTGTSETITTTGSSN